MAVDLSELSDELFVNIITDLIAAGVPPTTLAISFEIDPEITQEIASELHVRLYGEAELLEAMNHLQWKAYEEALKLLKTGTRSERMRTVNMILARTVGLAGKQPPGEIEKLRGELTDFARETRETEVEDEPSPFNVREA